MKKDEMRRVEKRKVKVGQAWSDKKSLSEIRSRDRRAAGPVCSQR